MIQPTAECPFFDVAGLAAYLGVRPLTVRRLVVAGKLRPSRVGRVLRFSEERVKRFLEGKNDA